MVEKKARIKELSSVFGIDIRTKIARGPNPLSVKRKKVVVRDGGRRRLRGRGLEKGIGVEGRRGMWRWWGMNRIDWIYCFVLPSLYTLKLFCSFKGILSSRKQSLFTLSLF